MSPHEIVTRDRASGPAKPFAQGFVPLGSFDKHVLAVAETPCFVCSRKIGIGPYNRCIEAQAEDLATFCDLPDSFPIGIPHEIRLTHEFCKVEVVCRKRRKRRPR